MPSQTYEARRASSPLVRALALLCCLIALSGCTAMAKYDNDAEPAPFSATANNLGSIYVAAKGYRPQRTTSFDFVLSPVAIPIWVATLPVSLAFDLLTSPYDVLRSDQNPWGEAHRRRWEKFEVATGGAPDAPGGESAPADSDASQAHD